MTYILEVILAILLLFSSVIYLVFPKKYAKYREGEVKENTVAIFRVFGLIFLLISIGIFITIIV